MLLLEEAILAAFAALILLNDYLSAEISRKYWLLFIKFFNFKN